MPFDMGQPKQTGFDMGASAKSSFDMGSVKKAPEEDTSAYEKAGEAAEWTTDSVIGGFESLANLGTDFITYGLSAVGAGLAGAGSSLVSGEDFDADAFEAATESTYEKLSPYTVYKPQSEKGQEMTGALMDVFHKMDSAFKGAGDKAFEAAESSELLKDYAPEIGTTVYAGLHGLTMLAPKIGKIGYDKVTAPIKEKRAAANVEEMRGEKGYTMADEQPFQGPPAPELPQFSFSSKEGFNRAYEAEYPMPKTKKAQKTWESKRDKAWTDYQEVAAAMDKKIYEIQKEKKVAEIKDGVEEHLSKAEEQSKDPGFIDYEQPDVLPGLRPEERPMSPTQEPFTYPESKLVDRYADLEARGARDRQRSDFSDPAWEKLQEENASYTRRQQEQSARKAVEEEMAYAERDIFTAETRAQEALNRVSITPTNLGGTGKRGFGQGGAVDIKALGDFVESVRGKVKNFDEFQTKLMQKFGDDAKLYASMLWDNQGTVQQVEPPMPTGKAKVPYYNNRGIASTVLEYSGGQAIAPLRKRAADSPALTKVLDQIEHPEWQRGVDKQRTTTPDLTERRLLTTGEFIEKYTSAVEPVTKKILHGPRSLISGKLKKGVNDRIVKQLATGKRTYGKAAVAADNLRALLDSVYKYAEDAGVPVAKYLKNYFPHRLNTSKLGSGFERLLIKYGADPVYAKNLVNEMVNGDGFVLQRANDAVRASIVDYARKGDKRLPNRRQTKSAIEYSRVLLDSIPFDELRPYLDTDLGSVIPKYIDNVVRRVEMAKAFGPNYELLSRDLYKAIDELNAKGTGMSEWEVGRLFDILDAYQHRYKPYGNRRAVNLERMAHTWMNVKTLGLVTMTSFPEVAVPLVWAGPKAYTKGLSSAVLNTMWDGMRVIYRDLPKTQAVALSEMMMKAVDIGTLERITSMYNSDVNMVNGAFFKAVGLHSWTKFVNLVSQQTFDYMFKDIMKSKGKKFRAKYEQDMWENTLRWFGMDADVAYKWYKEGMPKDSPVYNQYKASMMRFIHHSVPVSRPAVRPLWHSNPHPLAKSVAHLKGFPSLYGNTIAKNVGLQLMDNLNNTKGLYTTSRKALNMGMGIALGMVIADWSLNQKDELMGREKKQKDLPTEKRLSRAFDYAGYYGILSNLMMATKSSEFGGNPATTLLGPTTAFASDFVEAVYNASNGNNRQLARWMVKNAMIPNGFFTHEQRMAQYDSIETMLDNISPAAKQKLIDDYYKQLGIDK